MPDEKLLQFYLNSNPTALGTLTALYKDRIYYCVYNMVHDKYLAEEIFREVFVRIIHHMMTGKTLEEGNFLDWALQLAKELCIEKRCKTQPAYGATTTTGNIVWTSVSLYYDQHAHVRNMIDLLPESQREVITLHHYAGVSFREIATRLQCSVTNVLDVMKSGLCNLSRLLSEESAAYNDRNPLRKAG